MVSYLITSIRICPSLINSGLARWDIFRPTVLQSHHRLLRLVALNRSKREGVESSARRTCLQNLLIFWFVYIFFKTLICLISLIMDAKSEEKSEENLTKEINNSSGSSDLNCLSDCQNSSETVTNERVTDNNEIRVLANNLDKTLSVNRTVNNLPNGIAHHCDNDEIEYVSYRSELQMPDIMRLIQRDLSEPYSIYTYRYFIHNWPKLCFLAVHNGECVGAVVCKLDVHRKLVRRGYIAMLAVDQKYRKRKIGSNLVLKAIRAMSADNADEVVLETEITNRPALKLYENLGFVRDKRLFRYYLNGVDALRLKLWLR